MFAYLLAEFMRTWTPNGYQSAGWLTLDEDERYLSPPGGLTARAVLGSSRGAKTDPSDGEGTKVVFAPAIVPDTPKVALAPGSAPAFRQ